MLAPYGCHIIFQPEGSTPLLSIFTEWLSWFTFEFQIPLDGTLIQNKSDNYVIELKYFFK